MRSQVGGTASRRPRVVRLALKRQMCDYLHRWKVMLLPSGDVGGQRTAKSTRNARPQQCVAQVIALPFKGAVPRRGVGRCFLRLWGSYL
jgi:hypothetical protein